MDIFFQKSSENYFNNFHLASDDKYGADEVINDNDDNIHDIIETRVAERVRKVSELDYIQNQ